jgi:hypothetical protein
MTAVPLGVSREGRGGAAWKIVRPAYVGKPLIASGFFFFAYHVGQIVLLAKHAAGPAWQTLSIARNRSAGFNARMPEGR